jgi:hypothetical protein
MVLKAAYADGVTRLRILGRFTVYTGIIKDVSLKLFCNVNPLVNYLARPFGGERRGTWT